MTKTICAALLLSAAPLAAAITRVVVRCDSGSATIIGAPGDAVVAASSRRIDADTVEVTPRNGETIRVPATASIEWLSSGNANAHIRDIGGNVILRTGNGNLDVANVRGLVEVTTGNGITTVANVGGGVQVISISGRTTISCIAGTVVVKDTSGNTMVTSAGGDVDLFTALGKARYDGALRPDHAYRLRTLDGAVAIGIAPGGAGYAAELSADSGQIDLDRPLAGKPRRTTLREGDGRARVVLDAVGGRVELTRIGAAVPSCR